MATRGRTIPVRPWWRLLAAADITRDERGLVELGRDLAKRIKRPRPFDHGTLSNVVHGKQDPTIDLIEAICEEFRLPPPVFFPRTVKEAMAMFDLKTAYDDIVERQGEAELVDIETVRRGPRKPGKSMVNAPGVAVRKPGSKIASRR